jgi:hypothetical protein
MLIFELLLGYPPKHPRHAPPPKAVGPIPGLKNVSRQREANSLVDNAFSHNSYLKYTISALVDFKCNFMFLNIFLFSRHISADHDYSAWRH